MDEFQILLLAGGHSSRMGSPKHLLPVANGPLYLHLIRTLHKALPQPKTYHISLADRSIIDDNLREGVVHIDDAPAAPATRKLIAITDDASQDIGPAAGLLAAHRYDPSATWLVIACDYPLLQVHAVSQLTKNYEPPVTCFKNVDGFCEPLLAMWSPHALESLKQNVDNGRLGPSYTVKKLGGKLLEPTKQDWLVNVNTKQEWDAVQHHLQSIHSREAL